MQIFKIKHRHMSLSCSGLGVLLGGHMFVDEMFQGTMNATMIIHDKNTCVTRMDLASFVLGDISPAVTAL